jgi:hypothetical protein
MTVADNCPYAFGHWVTSKPYNASQIVTQSPVLYSSGGKYGAITDFREEIEH